MRSRLKSVRGHCFLPHWDLSQSSLEPKAPLKTISVYALTLYQSLHFKISSETFVVEASKIKMKTINTYFKIVKTFGDFG